MLTAADVCLIHENIIREYGGMCGERDIATIESTLNSIYQTMDGEELVTDELDRAARLFYGLIEGHGFNDGNKRTALNVLQYFLNEQGYKLSAKDEELKELAIKIASKKCKCNEIYRWLILHTLAGSKTHIEVPNKTTIKAIKEGDAMIKHGVKGYSDTNAMFNVLSKVE